MDGICGRRHGWQVKETSWIADGETMVLVDFAPICHVRVMNPVWSDVCRNPYKFEFNKLRVTGGNMITVHTWELTTVRN
jgi:hypothetical protein